VKETIEAKKSSVTKGEKTEKVCLHSS